MHITSVEALRTLYSVPSERAVKKQLSRLDAHCRRFIAQSPLVVVASSGTDLTLDASPRGGEPGFVKVFDSGTLLIPDSPGNNRLDTLENIVQTGRVGLLFLVPGLNESLRVNGKASLSTSDVDLTRCTDAKRRPKLVIRVAVEAAYLHCAKALMRSALWDPTRHIDPLTVPSLGEIIKDQLGSDQPAASREQMLTYYLQDL